MTTLKTISYSISPISPSADATGIAFCNGSAFHADRHWAHQHGLTPLPEIIANTTLRTPWTLTTNRHRFRVLKAVDNATGEIIAYARWILPASLVGNENIWPEALVPAVAEQEMDDFRAKSESAKQTVNREMVVSLGNLPERKDNEIRARYPGREFLELDYLAVKPGFQGQGLGSMFVRLGLEKAKDLGLEFIVMGFTEQGRALYARIPELSFAGEVVQDCSRWPEGRKEGCECVAGFWIGGFH